MREKYGRALPAIAGLLIGLAIAAWLTRNIGPTPEVWGPYLP
jgi:hypothetical protein